MTSTKSSGVKLPEVHGVSKSLDPNIQPEKQKPLQGNKILQDKPHTGQGRAGMRRRRRHLPINQTYSNIRNCQRKFLKYQK